MKPFQNKIKAIEFSIKTRIATSYRSALLNPSLFSFLLIAVFFVLFSLPENINAATIYDDEFNSSTLNSKWHWIREDSSHWSLTASPGSLRIVTQNFDIFQDNNTAPILLQELQPLILNNLVVQTYLTINPVENYQQGGLVIFQDDDNYVRLTYAYIAGLTFEFARETNAVFQPIQVTAPQGTAGFHLRIVKRDNNYYGFYSQDGENWVYIAAQSNVKIFPTQIGITAFNSLDINNEIPVDFDYFHAEESWTFGDPLRNEQWYLNKINAEPAWLYTEGSIDTIIAILDSGVDYSHVDLKGHKTDIQNDRDLVNNDNDAMDDYGHGTHVAGIAAAITNNGEGIAGICPLCRILPIKIANNNDDLSADNVADAINYATEQGANVINLSLGINCTPKLANAINNAYDHNVVLVAAAGNTCPVEVALGSATFSVNYPAKFERVIAVAATDQGDNRANFSSYGTEIDISAPGVSILSTYRNGKYKRLDGTSMASPIVAGTAGLLKSLDPLLTPAQVQDILQRSADDIGEMGWDQYTGWGRINTLKAVNTAKSTVSEATPVACAQNTSTNATNDLISLYTQLRDDVLSTSSVGNQYTNLFYTYGPELANILIANPTLRDRTAQFLADASDEFGSLLSTSNQKLILSQAIYDEANALVNDLAQAGSEDFRTAALETWQVLDLDKHIGENTKAIWQEMNSLKTYLPVVVH